jgi:hypothetical protein
MIISELQIEDLINKRSPKSVKEINVLRANGQLPVNVQVGATCGIYALQAAFQIKGSPIAPPARKRSFDDSTGGWRTKNISRGDSIRGLAKIHSLTKLGEIGSATDLVQLASHCGIAVTIKRFGSETELWKLIKDSVKAGKGIVMPYACADNDGSPAVAPNADSFAHWCLLFGCVEYTNNPDTVFMTTYGVYQEVLPKDLYQANQNIKDWAQQEWIKLAFWAKDDAPSANWQFWSRQWLPKKQSDLLDSIKMMAASTGQGMGLGVGDEQRVLHKVLDPPKPANYDLAPILKLVRKTADLQAAEYTKTLKNQCVVV